MTDTMTEKRPVGRPPRQQEVQERRRRREGLGADRNLKLHVPAAFKDPNFTYRFVNDRPGRVQQMTVADDWDVVDGGEAIQNESLGTTVKRTADKQTGESAVLLRKPIKFHEEDQAQKKKAIDAQEEGLRRAAPASPEGISGPESYVPNGRNIVGGK